MDRDWLSPNDRGRGLFLGPANHSLKFGSLTDDSKTPSLGSRIRLQYHSITARTLYTPLGYPQSPVGQHMQTLPLPVAIHHSYGNSSCSHSFFPLLLFSPCPGLGQPPHGVASVYGSPNRDLCTAHVPYHSDPTPSRLLETLFHTSSDHSLTLIPFSYINPCYPDHIPLPSPLS